MVNQVPSSSSVKQAIIDYLAIDRTALSNERTFLAVIRTSLTLLIVGISLLNFLDHPAYDIIAYICLAAAPVVLLFGIIRYFQYKSYLSRMSNKHYHLKQKIREK